MRRDTPERECLLSWTVEPSEGRVRPDAWVGRGAESREICAALEGWAGGSQAEKWWSEAVNGLKQYGFVDWAGR